MLPLAQNVARQKSLTHISELHSTVQTYVQDLASISGVVHCPEETLTLCMQGEMCPLHCSIKHDFPFFEEFYLF